MIFNFSGPVEKHVPGHKQKIQVLTVAIGYVSSRSNSSSNNNDRR